MKRVNYDKLVNLRLWMNDPIHQMLNLRNSFSSVPAKKTKRKKNKSQSKRKKRYLERRTQVEIEDISDGNL